MSNTNPNLPSKPKSPNLRNLFKSSREKTPNNKRPIQKKNTLGNLQSLVLNGAIMEDCKIKIVFNSKRL